VASSSLSRSYTTPWDAAVVGFEISLRQMPFEAMTYTFSPLVLVHAFYMLGWRRASAFFFLSLVISFGFEYVGVKTGWIFGHYHYTDVLNPKILETVPFVIPLAYFMVIYPSYMMCNLIIRGRPTGKFQGWAVILLSSLLTSMIMTSWDLTMDPVMVHDVKAWVWERSGEYFGVPFHNFCGWLITVFVISAIFRFIEQVDRFPMRPLGRGHKTIILMPLLGYGALMIGGPFVGTPIETRLLSPFAMGLPLFAALMRLYDPGKRSRFSKSDAKPLA
jgi:putative membrane protein